MSDSCVHCGKYRAGSPALKVVKDGFATHFIDIIDPELCGNCVTIPEDVRKTQKDREVALRAQAKKLLAEADHLIQAAHATNVVATELTGKQEDEPLTPVAIAARVDAIAGSKEARRV